VATTKPAEDRPTSLQEQLRERLDDPELQERLDDVLDRAEHVRDDVIERAEHLRDDVLERAEHLRDDVLERAEHLREDVQGRMPELLEELEPAKRKAQIKGWELVRQLAGLLLIVPRLVVRMLGALPQVVEDAAEHGGDLAERAREAAGSVPAVQRSRRRRRMQLFAGIAAGFAAGTLFGWLLARRRPAEVPYEATQGDIAEVPVPSIDGTSPVAPDAIVRE
jgi:hypothetical protein